MRNRYIGKKDGIWVVHRDVIVGAARLLCRAIIEIGKLSASKRSQETKETRLYDYIVGEEFSRGLNIYAKFILGL